MRKIKNVMLLLAVCLVLAGCSDKKNEQKYSNVIYYLRADGMALEKEGYVPLESETEAMLEEMLQKLKEAPKEEGLKSALPESVEILSTSYEGNVVKIDFSEDYEKINYAEEALLKEAYVRTLVQIEGVNAVQFIIKGKPEKDRNGKVTGLMYENDFVQNTGSAIHSYQKKNLTLYFADESGENLIKENVNVRYNSNLPLERVVIEQLQKGPAEEKNKRTLPADMKIIGVSVRDGICYVNFDTVFLDYVYNLDPALPIYSIVNSIVESGGASKVQILVNGETTQKFQGSIQLDEPFSRNLELVKGEKE